MREELSVSEQSLLFPLLVLTHLICGKTAEGRRDGFLDAQLPGEELLLQDRGLLEVLSPDSLSEKGRQTSESARRTHGTARPSNSLASRRTAWRVPGCSSCPTSGGSAHGIHTKTQNEPVSALNHATPVQP